MGNALTFAQLSDPHLSSPDGARWRELANKRLLGYLSWRRRRRAEHRGEVLEALQRDLHGTRPGHLVITGDLTQIALPDEFRQSAKGQCRLLALCNGISDIRDQALGGATRRRESGRHRG